MNHSLRRTTRLSLAALLLVIGCGCSTGGITVINTDPNNNYYPGRMFAPNFADPYFSGNAYSPY